MRVVHLIKTDGIAGAEAHLLVLLPLLARRGVDVRVLFIAPVSGAGADFAEAVESHGIAVDRIPICGHGSPALIPAIARALRKLKPDIAHAHLFHAELWGVPAAKLVGVPRVVISRHNDDPRRRRQPLRTVYRGVWPMIDVCVCISNSVRRAAVVEGAPGSQAAHDLVWASGQAAGEQGGGAGGAARWIRASRRMPPSSARCPVWWRSRDRHGDPGGRRGSGVHLAAAAMGRNATRW
ncbi:MAG: glycosyltransferase [Chloroflexi bacterium]|nr:glycosyltransferase [Chloroflexota bacterium]